MRTALHMYDLHLRALGESKLPTEPVADTRISYGKTIDTLLTVDRLR